MPLLFLSHAFEQHVQKLELVMPIWYLHYYPSYHCCLYLIVNLLSIPIALHPVSSLFLVGILSCQMHIILVVFFLGEFFLLICLFSNILCALKDSNVVYS